MTALRPDISVVVPFRNLAESVDAAIRSLLALEARNFAYEVIAVDNRSTDGTAARLRAHEPRIRVVDCATSGAAAARNAGVREARGRYVAFMDGDCIAEPDWLAAFLTAAQSAPPRRILGGPILPMDTASPISVFAQNLYDQERAVTDARWPYAVTCNMFLERETMIEAKLFDEQLLRSQDVDFSWRAARACGATFGFVPGARVLHDNPSTLRGLIRKGLQHGAGGAYLSTRHAGATGLTHWRRIRDGGPYRRIARDVWGALGPGREGVSRADQFYWAVFNTAKQSASVLHNARCLLGMGLVRRLETRDGA